MSSYSATVPGQAELRHAFGRFGEWPVRMVAAEQDLCHWNEAGECSNGRSMPAYGDVAIEAF
jgi:hypothetical protein